MTQQVVTTGTRFEDAVLVQIPGIFNWHTKEAETISLRVFVEQSEEGFFKVGIEAPQADVASVESGQDGVRLFLECTDYNAQVNE